MTAEGFLYALGDSCIYSIICVVLKYLNIYVNILNFVCVQVLHCTALVVFRKYHIYHKSNLYLNYKFRTIWGKVHNLPHLKTDLWTRTREDSTNSLQRVMSFVVCGHQIGS